MIPRSSEKSGGTAQTWGIVATLIKQQEQLNEPLCATPNLDDGEPVLESNLLERSVVEINTVVKINSFDDDIENDDLMSLDDTMNIEHDAFGPWLSQEDASEIDVLSLVTIEGSAYLQFHIRILLEKYRSVFATTLPPEPAIIPPFELNVDKLKWEVFANRGPPRIQSPAKEAEIFRQVDELLKAGIIEPSTAPYYSQVILASKSDDTWRFCIDYRNLNDCTQSASWPIPNIKSMFNRLGTHRSDTFGVMDLTSGYHQAPVDLFTRIFLAFICFCCLSIHETTVRPQEGPIILSTNDGFHSPSGLIIFHM